MSKKYEFTGETKEFFGRTLKRIRRISDRILGGWLQWEHNLSQGGDCWVGDEAMVFDFAQVSGSAVVSGSAMVFDSAQVSGSAWVFDSAWVYDSARVFDSAQVSGYTQVYGSAHIGGAFVVCGGALLYDPAVVSGSTSVNTSGDITSTSKVSEDWPKKFAETATVYNKIETAVVPKAASCSCGAVICNLPVHSTWCDLYRKE